MDRGTLGHAVIHEDDLAAAGVVGCRQQHTLGLDVTDTVGLEVCHDDDLASDQHLGGVLCLDGGHDHALADAVEQGELEAGMRKKNFFKMNAYKLFEELSSGKQYEDAVYKPFGNEYTGKEGRKFRVSKMQMMQAILSYEREQSNFNMRHVDTGGFSFADLSLLEKGNVQKAVSKEHSHDVPAAGWMVAEFNEALKGDFPTTSFAELSEALSALDEANKAIDKLEEVVA